MRDSSPEAATKQPTQIVQLTPMMEQYLRMKERAGDALLFFRMGDFYELFHEDAIVASKAMNITLTSRQKMHDAPIPMCGFPAHSAESYIDRLLQQGFKVAICEHLSLSTNTSWYSMRPYFHPPHALSSLVLTVHFFSPEFRSTAVISFFFMS